MVTTKGSNENDSVTSGLHEHRCNCCILVKRSSFHFRIVCHHKLINFIQNSEVHLSFSPRAILPGLADLTDLEVYYHSLPLQL